MRSFLAITGLVLSFGVGTLGAQPADDHAEKIANIRKMIELTGGTRIVDQIFNSMAANFKDPKQAEFFTQFRKEFDMNQVYEIMIPAWDKYLTGDDIKAIIVFYRTPAGQNLLVAQPKIMAEAMPAVMQWSQDIAQKLMQKMKEKGLQ